MIVGNRASHVLPGLLALFSSIYLCRQECDDPRSEDYLSPIRPVPITERPIHVAVRVGDERVVCALRAAGASLESKRTEKVIDADDYIEQTAFEMLDDADYEPPLRVPKVPSAIADDSEDYRLPQQPCYPSLELEALERMAAALTTSLTWSTQTHCLHPAEMRGRVRCVLTMWHSTRNVRFSRIPREVLELILAHVAT
jgi:hypothetical protein